MREIDPFKMLPIVDRTQLKSEAVRIFNQTVEKIALIIPVNELNGEQLSFVPAGFLLDDSIHVFSRTQLREKVRYPLVIRQPFHGYQMVLSVRKEHIVPILAGVVDKKNAKLLRTTFLNGRIGIDTFGSRSQSFLHISVVGKVWMGHNLTLVAGFGQLRYQASWSYWRYSVKANLCWPVCGKVMDEATKEIEKLIESKKYFNGSIPSSIPGKYICRITPDVLLFYFN